MTRPPTEKILAAALAALALGACTARDPARTGAVAPRFASLDATLDGRAAAPPRAATPVAVLPEWIGRPLRLRERDEADAFEQVVALSLAPRGEGRENLVLLRAGRGREAEPAGAAPGGRPTEAGIRAELDAVFPDTPMRVVTRPASNAYGPYGLAIGRSPRGARCLYAWQWIEDAPALDSGARRPVSLRVRLCRDDVTLEAMAAAVNKIRLVPRFEGTPVAAVAAQARSASRPHRREAARTAKAPEPAAERVEAQPVPEPAAAPIASSGRRYLGAVDAPAALPPSPAAPGPAALRGVFAGPGAAAQAGLSADLPPEALRGPTARPAGRL